MPCPGRIRLAVAGALFCSATACTFFEDATTRLPGPRQALHLAPGVWLSNRGLAFAWPEAHPGWTMAGIGLALAIASSVLLHLWARRRQACVLSHASSRAGGLSGSGALGARRQ